MFDVIVVIVSGNVGKQDPLTEMMTWLASESMSGRTGKLLRSSDDELREGCKEVLTEKKRWITK